MLTAMDDLQRSGKIRYLGVSNFSGWHLMKTLAASERDRLIRPVAQQIHYTLQAREAEYELLPIAVDQGVDAVVWSPLAGGLLSGKYRRGKPGGGRSRRCGTSSISTTSWRRWSRSPGRVTLPPRKSRWPGS
jgi:aryl-alcohol dehydrogenase-like predicted oxidoreductase